MVVSIKWGETVHSYMHKKERQRERMAIGTSDSSSSSSSSSDVFETGNYEVKTMSLKKSHTTKPPVDLFIVAPLEKGTYPLLIFCHGFLLTNTWYSTLFKHIASHGYILIAPKVQISFTFHKFLILITWHDHQSTCVQQLIFFFN